MPPSPPMTAPRTLAAALLAQLVLALAGALIGTACDQIHVQAHVLAYPRGVAWLAGQALWVPPLFASAALVLVGGYAVSARLLGGDRAPARPRDVLFGLLAFACAYLCTGLLARHPTFLTTLLVLGWLVRVIAQPHRPQVLYALVCAAGGPLFEAALSSTGAFYYTQPAWWVPIWLPALYLHVAPLIRHLWAVFFRPPIVTATSEHPPYLRFHNLEHDRQQTTPY